MAVSIKYIQFNHFLFDAVNVPESGIKVIVQFYNVHVKSWMSLTQEIALLKGKFAHQLTVPSRISTSDQTIRVVREVLKSGGTPSFRLIKSSPGNKHPEVIVANFKAIIEGDTKLTLDFGKSWLLKDDAHITKGDHIVIASQIPMFELTNSIRIIEVEKEEATAKVTDLNATIATMSTTQETLNSELSIVRNQIIEKEQLASDLDENVRTLTANLANEQLLRETLETNQAMLETQVTTQQEQISNLEIANVADSNYQDLYIALEQQVVNVNIERDNLQQEKVAFLASIDQLQQAVKLEKLTVKSKTTELETQQVLVNSLQKKTLVLERELEGVRDFNATEHPNKLSASKVYGSIVNDVIKADEELVNSRYKLANVSLNLKTTVEKGPDGTVFGLLDFETAKGINGAAISDISIDIVPTGTTTTNVGQKMPNILGLTETAVRKIIRNSGLKLDAIYHPTTDDSFVAGQSFKQSPMPDASIVEGQEVIVIFAKPIN